MPPKPKSSAKANTLEPKDAPPDTVSERSQQRFHQTNPVQKRVDDAGFPGLTPAEKKTYAHARLILPVSRHSVPLSNKTEREFWKHVAKEALPIRKLPANYTWGHDRSGRDLGAYKLDEHRQRSLNQANLTALNLLHRRFLAKRADAAAAAADGADQQASSQQQEDLEEEKKRRRKMAELRRQLYGTIPGSLADDPEWDDVAPIAYDEPADALARIAYPDAYAEATSYLRAVMAVDEHSPRALRLTETVIGMNPAHYTVWLYRFQIIKALGLPATDEIAWLNEVALDHLKNYQIWNHRQLLLDFHHPSLAGDPAALRRFAKSELDFATRILEEDTKNYHVWCYRQYLVARLGLFTPAELCATQSMIEDDLRNNSAWSHRFFLVFSDPDNSTPGCGPTQHDPRVPPATIDRELAYAREKILLAPQNQSAWHYLRGVLVKGGRALGSEAAFVAQFFDNLGDDAAETVRSSHALDLMSEVYAAAGDVDKARLCLQRLWEKWDPVREGYWRYRSAELKA
ncbi:Protein farnesyltransferase/geranylgeranyltransferase type-1 subunit alpha [Escovopsis weberi]|uniref:Protein farnesyltransferase/geranylgeranyltransferase type-1 subunit alpha n=1 Tax=Escovopsis weberi TaxID=150374 RepID=A0A0M8N078_ESCWE|nr:Protein farnesyltransferase/geranylgeranyltransferase type-1 subunit alpha [Escovopsis weberi]